MPALTIEATRSRLSTTSAILTAWLVAGIMDISAAIIVYDYILHKTTAMKLLKYIATGVFGRQATTGGNEMAIYGLLCHFLIALIFTVFYFLMYPQLPFLRKSKLLSGVLYGLFVWAVMNFGIVPLFGVAKIPTNGIAMARAAIILVVCIGLPIALIIGHYYQTRRTGEH